MFFISGLVLKTDELKAALRHRLGVIYGFIAVLGITPCLGFAYREIPLTPSAFAAGAPGAQGLLVSPLGRWQTHPGFSAATLVSGHCLLSRPRLSPSPLPLTQA